MGYLANFIVYTLAMVGVMGVSLFAFKKFALNGQGSVSKNLKVLDTMSLGPRKTLYIVSAGGEKFLIAGDTDRTTLISKLGEAAKQTCETAPVSDFKETLESLNAKTRYADKSIIGIKSSQKSPYTSVIKSLAERIKE